MIPPRHLAALAIAGTAGLLVGALGLRAVEGGVPHRAAIEALVRDYVLSHPEIIPEAMQRLHDDESAKAIADNRAAIVRPFAGAWAGNREGDVTLVMFSDYQCGYCRASAPDIDRLLAEDPRLKVVWREIPVLGPQSEVAARVALAAAKQGRYLPFHRALFAGGRADDTHLVAAARSAGLDPRRIGEDRGGADIQAEIAANLALAGKLGVTGTPAFVVGDRMVSGAVGHDALAAAIAAARRG